VKLYKNFSDAMYVVIRKVAARFGFRTMVLNTLPLGRSRQTSTDL